MIQQAAKERKKSERSSSREIEFGVPGLRKRAKKEAKQSDENERLLGDERADYEDCDDTDSETDEGASTRERREGGEVEDGRAEPNERTPLFGLTGQRGGREISVDKDGFVHRMRNKVVDWGNGIGASAKKTRKEDLIDVGKTAVSSIPAVILG